MLSQQFLRAGQMENVEDQTFWAEWQECRGEECAAPGGLQETPRRSGPDSCFEAVGGKGPVLARGFNFWAVGLAVDPGLRSAALAAPSPQEVHGAVLSPGGTSREVEASMFMTSC